MNDKRSLSERASARPPLPSIAPPTDDIDSEWGDDAAPAVPAAPKLPQLSPSVAPAVAAPSHESVAAPAPVAAQPEPARAPLRSSLPPRPEAVTGRATSTIPPRPASIAPAPTSPSSPPGYQNNPLRKQTLLGIAPVIPERASQPPSAAATTTPTDNPLRKQTLLGIAPVIPERASEAPAAAEPEVAEARAPAARDSERPAPNADVLASDAPTTRDVSAAAPRPTPPAAIHTPLTVSGAGDIDDLPPLRSRRPRWVLPVSAAAVLLLGVVGLRALDHAPPSPRAERGATPAAAAPAAKSKSAIDSVSDFEGLEELSAAAPSAAPEPATSAGSAPTPSDAAPTDNEAPPSDAPASDAPSAGATRINVISDPPGARMFWKGKEVGTTPFVLELPAGQRRSFELGKPGFVTRKVVIDGTKSELTIGLKPQ